MAGSFFSGLGQTIAGGIATAATLGLNDDVIKWTEEGASNVANSAKDTWGADGDVTQFLEGIPGYVASAGHGIAGAITGNEDDLQRARRACAASTKSTLVTGGAIGGALVGGPIGAAAGAALGSVGGQCSEKGINHANNKEFQTSGGTFHNFDAKDFVGEVIIDATLGGICAGVGDSAVTKSAARSAVGPSLKEAGGGGIKRFATKRAVQGMITKPVGKAAEKGFLRPIKGEVIELIEN